MHTVDRFANQEWLNCDHVTI